MTDRLRSWFDLLPRPLDFIGSIKLKLAILLLGSGAAGGAVLWYGLGMMPPKTTFTAALVALLTSQVLAHGMTSPLRQMTAAAQAMARGDYSVRVRATSHDEVGRLAEAFNRMAADLAAADGQRRELVANVSHELRTPIAALQAMLENLADGVAKPSTQSLSAAVAQTERLGRLVTELLDVSRLDAGDTPLRRTGFDVRSFVDDAIAEATFHSDIDTHVDVPEGLCGYADVERLHQVMANLLANAVRHNRPGGTVSVTARHRDDCLLLEVADEGPGIAPADRARIFERFTRGERSTRDGGTGLGLAIARWIVELHGGGIEVTEASPGAVIRVRLPLESKEEGISMNEPEPHPDAAATLPAPVTPPMPLVRLPGPVSLGSWWRGTAAGASWRFLLSAAVVAVFGAFAIVADSTAGVGVGLALTGMALVLLPLTVAGGEQRSAKAVGAAMVCALWSVVALRDADWLDTLCVLAALGLTTLVLVPPRRFGGMILGGVAMPLAIGGGTLWTFRGLLGMAGRGFGELGKLVRVAVISGALLLVFGTLFAAADPTFAGLVNRLLPEPFDDTTTGRMIVGGLLFGALCLWGYIATTAPRFDDPLPTTTRPASRVEWAIPLGLLCALFAAFLTVQATAFFGGEDYVLRTAGLTYAEYARTGFWQLSAVTMLTLLVIAVAAWKAPRAERVDRLWVRLLLGTLCVLALVVVASAIYRMNLYADAYGLTRLRVWVLAVELWVAAVFGMVLACGWRLKASWLPRAVLASGVAMLLGLALVNPDALIARYNIDRHQHGAELDLNYLAGLSADAVPEFAALSEADRACVLSLMAPDYSDETVLTWNLSRHNAATLVGETASGTEPVDCDGSR
ncbi:DUF4153 domain-containing protein [Stackebrandtia nassauensis]|uniref:histidine kinase n=1 Tax=Stackebrandtia nassauensis (strain DSM 44728 / CIP 108903 / NRRL B-16338 / NBRC 102104 / LLR-40K-21) TaxID=446470 RepID=D3PW34_STANL|nr:DUF4153 domain-containing protein [Stackebrandtia nassauensis]ADD45155.1 histidine kinase [Stackebrandtia nassauensis DSM 44728]